MQDQELQDQAKSSTVAISTILILSVGLVVSLALVAAPWWIA